MLKYLLITIFVLSGCQSTPIITDSNKTIPMDKTGDYWTPIRSPAAHIPNGFFKEGLTVCVNISYTIGSDGKTYNHQVLKTYPNKNKHFEKSAIKAISAYKYVPTDANIEREAISTNKITTFFVVNDDTLKSSITQIQNILVEACKI